MYDYLPITSKMECVKVSGNVEINEDKWLEESSYGLTLEQVLNRAEKWHYNLLIIILDETLSWQYFQESKKVSVWSEAGANGHIVYPTKTIISRTHSEATAIDGIEQTTATRTMAHEIAHFVVYEIYEYELASGTSKTIAEKAVHDIDELFDKCVEKDMLKTCNHLWVPLTTHYGDPIEVMSPYYVMKVAESMVAPKNNSIPPTPFENSNDNSNNNEDKINSLLDEFQKKSKILDNNLKNKISEYEKFNFKINMLRLNLDIF